MSYLTKELFKTSVVPNFYSYLTQTLALIPRCLKVLLAREFALLLAEGIWAGLIVVVLLVVVFLLLLLLATTSTSNHLSDEPDETTAAPLATSRQLS